MTPAALGRLLLLVAGLAAVGWMLRTVGAVPGTSWVDLHVRDAGWRGEATFLLLGMATTGLGLPRQAIAFLGGYAFGALEGTALALAAQLLGCAAGFLWARAVGRAWAERRLARPGAARLRPLVDTLRARPFAATLALRLFPVGNNLATNLLAGVAGLRPLPFLAASALGYLPQTLVFALLGKGVRVDGAWQVGLSLVLLALSVWLGVRVMRRAAA
ncbi:TVP38/TMEM64 family protein [Roseococcus sp. DSY-14]|uniref:TVP38/TMEM64 family protein n=1 Tax=Roseococcus sp. DSY-14 TaxID=3369650 RepID=UPI00387B8393